MGPFGQFYRLIKDWPGVTPDILVGFCIFKFLCKSFASMQTFSHISDGVKYW